MNNLKIEVFCDIYGIVNIYSNKVDVFDIDVEHLNLENIQDIFFDLNYSQVNVYKSKKGYTLICYKKNITLDDLHFNNRQIIINEISSDFNIEKYYRKINRFFTRLSPKIVTAEVDHYLCDEEKNKIDFIKSVLKYGVNTLSNGGLRFFWSNSGLLDYQKETINNFLNRKYYDAYKPYIEILMNKQKLSVSKFIKSYNFNKTDELFEKFIFLYEKQTKANNDSELLI